MAGGFLLSRFACALERQGLLGAADSGPIRLGRWTAGGGCPHMGCGGAQCVWMATFEGSTFEGSGFPGKGVIFLTLIFGDGMI